MTTDPRPTAAEEEAHLLGIGLVLQSLKVAHTLLDSADSTRDPAQARYCRISARQIHASVMRLHEAIGPATEADEFAMSSGISALDERLGRIGH